MIENDVFWIVQAFDGDGKLRRFLCDDFVTYDGMISFFDREEIIFTFEVRDVVCMSRSF